MELREINSRMVNYTFETRISGFLNRSVDKFGNNSSSNGNFTATTTTASPSSQSSNKVTGTSKIYEWIDIFLLTAFCTVFIVGVIGNSLVCYFFRSGRKKVARMGRLIFYLAITDLLASIVNPSLYAYWQITSRKKWHFGMIGCKVFPVLANCSITISLGIILLITIERCLVICRPFHPHMKDACINVSLLAIVLLSLACEIPLMIFSIIKPDGTCGVPNLLIDGFFFPSISIYIARDFIFLVTFITTALLIYLELYNKEHVKTLKQQKDLRKNRKIIKLLIILATVFTVLVFPREILHITYMMSWKFGTGIPYSETLRNINAAFKVLHMCNSACNIFIYAGLHSKFQRQLFRLIFTCCGKEYNRKESVSSEYPSTPDTNQRYFQNTNNTFLAISESTRCFAQYHPNNNIEHEYVCAENMPFPNIQPIFLSKSAHKELNTQDTQKHYLDLRQEQKQSPCFYNKKEDSQHLNGVQDSYAKYEKQTLLCKSDFGDFNSPLLKQFMEVEIHMIPETDI